MDDKTFRSIFVPLRWTYGLVPVLAGLDKFTNLLADWPRYMSPLAAHLLPVSVGTAMKLIGVVEVLVGLLVLGPWTRIGAYLATAWLTLIALNLVALGVYDVAVRDLVMAVGAYSLARLAETRQRRLL
jgi:hypothetical protein